MDCKSAQNWLDRCVAAWRSYDPDDVSGLFSEDIAYRYHPYDQPIAGRGASRDASTRVPSARGDWEGSRRVSAGLRRQL